MTAVLEVPANGEREGDAVAKPTPPAPSSIVGRSGAAPSDRATVTAHLAVTAALSTAASAWLVGGLLRSPFAPRMLGVAGGVLGVAMIWWLSRIRRPGLGQYLLVPVAVVAGAVAISPVASGGTANLPGLVGEALRGGGLLSPPIPFDPGWRFILVAVHALLGGVAVSLAVTLGRPKVAVVVPLPLIVGAALLAPEGSEVVGSAVAIALVIGSMTVAAGADVADGAGRGFEARRLGRAVGMVALLMVAIVGLAQTDILFPDADRDQIIPPRKPPSVPPEDDRELFTVETDRVGPWRLGVLDVYDGEDWLLPPADNQRTGTLPVPGPGDETIAFRVTDMRGRSLPVPAQLTALAADAKVEYDPRLEAARLASRLPRGLTYEAAAAPLPSAATLNDAGPAPLEITDDFVRGSGTMPPAPSAVVALLSDAPLEPFDRLQYVRDRFYANVIAAGEGSPIAVPPARVGQIVSGPAEATPFEITAAEALLARWAGLPARIGYGYYGGDPIADGFSLRPRHGSAWLEVYFNGFGWIPLVGTPPQAKASDADTLQNVDPRVQASDELSLSVLIPVQRPVTALLFELVRYWVLRLVPIGIGVFFLLWTYPAAMKVARRARRQRWGRASSPAAALLVTYSEFRDFCCDLNLGSTGATPLEFVAMFEDDEEHEELAWLTTRALWGDLARDLGDQDLDAAVELTDSLRTRILAEQPAVARFLGVISRGSLREPWNTTVPNLWPQPRVRARVSAAAGVVARPVARVTHGVRKLGAIRGPGMRAATE